MSSSTRGPSGAAKSLAAGKPLPPGPLVIDFGHYQSKLSVAGEDSVLVKCPTPDGIYGGEGWTASAANDDSGRKCVQDHDALESHVSTILNQLTDVRVDEWRAQDRLLAEMEKGERSILLCEPPLNPKANREREIAMAFDVFGAPNYYAATTSVLALYATGHTTGTVMDLGHAGCWVVPVYEGYALPHAIRFHEALSGVTASDTLRDLLVSDSGKYGSASQFPTVDDKEEGNPVTMLKHLVAENASGADSPRKQSFRLPDGKVVDDVRAFASCFDAFGVGGGQDIGVLAAAKESIRLCEVDMHADASNVVLCGGGANLQGLGGWLESNDLKLMRPSVPADAPSVPPQDWTMLGASILGSLTTFGSMWISRLEYQESGAAIVHRKCF